MRKRLFEHSARIINQLSVDSQNHLILPERTLQSLFPEFGSALTICLQRFCTWCNVPIVQYINQSTRYPDSRTLCGEEHSLSGQEG